MADDEVAVDSATGAVDSRPERIAVFRPDDGRLSAAVETIESHGAEAVPDPMLEVEPTGEDPRRDADSVIFTSRTGVEVAKDAGWEPGSAMICSIGATTADALREVGWSVEVVPAEYSSAGLVDALADRVEGQRVEIARSDHGSDVLIEGLERAGAYIHETVLYRLGRPEDSGYSTELVATGAIDAVVFTSSLTVNHFLEAARERNVGSTVRDGLATLVVGAIGEPTRRTAEDHGIRVDVVPSVADFDALVADTVGALRR